LQTDRSSRDDRISHRHWQGIAAFKYQTEPSSTLLARAAPAGSVLLLWLAGLGGLLWRASHRLGKAQP
jgi:ABC-2 type transport system permease protein